jgi:hypothetical protein
MSEVYPKLMKDFDKEKLKTAQTAIAQLCDSCNMHSHCNEERLAFCPVRRAQRALETEWLWK